jgi:hypothetical protein
LKVFSKDYFALSKEMFIENEMFLLPLNNFDLNISFMLLFINNPQGNGFLKGGCLTNKINKRKQNKDEINVTL